MDIQTKGSIRTHISNANYAKALEVLAKYAINNKDTDLANQVILLQGQLTKTQREFNLNLINTADNSRDLARISYSIIKLINDSDDDNIVVIDNSVKVNNYTLVIGGVNYKDPIQIQNWLDKPFMNVASIYDEAIQIGKGIYQYLCEKWSNPRVIERYGNNLKYSIEDLESLKNESNFKTLKEAVTSLQEVLNEFLEDEMNKNILPQMWEKCLEVKDTKEYLDVYEAYLKKYIELNINFIDAETLINKFLADKNDLLLRIAGKTEMFIVGKIIEFQEKWTQK